MTEAARLAQRKFVDYASYSYDSGSFPDLISSYYRFRLAKINGGRNSDIWLDYLTECMSKSQIEQAEKRVSDWLAGQSEKSE